MILKPVALLAVGSHYLMASWEYDTGSQVIAIYRDHTDDGITNYTLAQPPRGEFGDRADPDVPTRSESIAHAAVFDLMDNLNDPLQGLLVMAEEWKLSGGKVYIQ